VERGENEIKIKKEKKMRDIIYVLSEGNLAAEAVIGR